MAAPQKSDVEKERERVDSVIEDLRVPGVADPSPSDVAHAIIKGKPVFTGGPTESEKVARDAAFNVDQVDLRTAEERSRDSGLDSEKRQAELDKKVGSDDRKKEAARKRKEADARKSAEARKSEDK